MKDVVEYWYGHVNTWKNVQLKIIMMKYKNKRRFYVYFQYERKHEKEQNEELTEKLDKEYKELMGSLSKSSVSFVIWIMF